MLALPPDHAAAIAAFRGFHRELAAVQLAISRSDWAALAEPGAAAPEPAAVARAVFARLCRAVVAASGPARPDRLHADVARPDPAWPGDGGAAGIARGYVIAAFADEALLDSPPWPGQAAWPGMLLEEGLYGSRIAGERLFEAAEALVAAPPGHPPPVASLLLLVLTLGFRGRYRGGSDGGAIARIAGQLHATLFRGTAPSLAVAERVLAELPLHVLAEPRGRRLPSARGWLAATLALAGVYLVASDVLWRLTADPIVALARAIAVPGLGGGG